MRRARRVGGSSGCWHAGGKSPYAGLLGIPAVPLDLPGGHPRLETAPFWEGGRVILLRRKPALLGLWEAAESALD